MSKETIIKISRSKYTEESLEVALIRLDTIFHYKGVLKMINYYTDSSLGSIDTVFASGVKDGVGRDCYRIISLHQDSIIWGAGSNLPDVSSLVHGEKYLYRDPSGDWWMVQIAADGRTRELHELQAGPKTYDCLSDGSKWVVSDDKKARRITDIYSQSEIDKLIEDVKNTVRYVDFESLTPTQVESIRGHKGDQGDKGDPGPMGLQGPPGIRGYNGTIENFVVLSESDYKALSYKDPYKFYFTYEEEDITPSTDFMVYVDGDVLVINSAGIDGNTLNLATTQAQYDDLETTLTIISSGSMVSTPSFTPIAGTYYGVKTIEILCSTPDAEIRYTLDWTEPTFQSNLYTGPLTLDSSATIKARAFKLGMLDSRTAVGTYDLLFQETVGTPILSPEGGVYNSQQVITIICSTPGATIRYTLDGTVPNETSAVYQNPIVVSDITNVVRARGFKALHNASDTATGIYEIESQERVHTPKFSIPSGTYTEDQEIVMSCSTAGATIRYTLDGTEPKESSTPYTDPIIISETTTIKAKAYCAGMVSSNVSIITVIIESPEPEPEPTGDIVVNGNTVEDTIIGNNVEGTTWVILSSARVENQTLII